jgi:hypothetical protein
MPKEEWCERTLKSRLREPIFTKSVRIEAIEPTQSNVWFAEKCAELFRGFQYRELDKMCRGLSEVGCPEGLQSAFRLSWFKCKIAYESFQEIRASVRYLFKNCLLEQGQEQYRDAMEHWIVPTLLEGDERKLVESKTRAQYPNECKLFDYLSILEPRLWLPVSFFPLWVPGKKSKMYLTWLPDGAGGMLNTSSGAGGPERRRRRRAIGDIPEEWQDPDSFDIVDRVKVLIRKYGGKDMWLPPLSSVWKTGTRKYNDGGVLRKDSEKPESSYDSQFLYCAYVTKHLTPRETWVPGKAIKHVNAWWFTFLDSFMSRIPYYAGGRDAEQVRSRMPRNIPTCIRFDISGFGLQFRRSVLEAVITAFEEMYPHPLVREMAQRYRAIWANFDIQLPSGRHIQPPRGAGLGYFETAKTIAVCALIDAASPISVFGDQALLPRAGGSLQALKNLASEGFVFKDETKIDETHPNAVYWAGAGMSKGSHVEPRSVWTPISGALEREYHWERKNALNGIEIPEEYKHIWNYLTFHYEYGFGFEFFKSESLQSIETGGFSPLILPQEGWCRAFEACKLRTPAYRVDGSVVYCTPFANPIARGEAKRFSIKRKKVWRDSANTWKKSVPTWIHTYVYPRIEVTDRKKVAFEQNARAVPVWADLRMLLFDNLTTHKVVSGLKDQELALAPVRQHYARDPFHARASGGYRIVTPYYGHRGPDMDMVNLASSVEEASHEKFSVALRIGETPEMHHVYSDPERFVDHPAFLGWGAPPPRTKNPYVKNMQGAPQTLDWVKALLFNTSESVRVFEDVVEDAVLIGTGGSEEQPEDFDDLDMVIGEDGVVAYEVPAEVLVTDESGEEQVYRPTSPVDDTAFMKVVRAWII